MTGARNRTPQAALRVIALGGLGEIGMNCLCLETERELIVIDCGLHFTDLSHFGVEFVVPNFGYLLERKDKVAAIFLTHGHEDHIGALPILLKLGIDAPVYASRFTSMLVRERLREVGIENEVDLRVFKMGERIALKDFGVLTVSVNHSIVDAAALIIDTPHGKVIHTGDFKIDRTPFYGKEIDASVFKRAGDEGVLLLLSDSTNVERHTHNPSESQVHKSFEELFAAAEGLIVVSMFASSISRIGQVLEVARGMGKYVALSGRSMEQNARLAQEIGYLRDAPHVLIGIDEIDRYPRNQVIVVCTGSQGEPRSSLARMAQGEHPVVQLEAGDQILMSSRMIPGNERAIGRMINSLFEQGADVLYEAIHDIHVSGHATRPELGQMLQWTRPQYFIPIHGEYRHLVHHADLAEEVGVKNECIFIAKSGDVVEIDRRSIRKAETLDETRVLVEDRAGTEITRQLLKERRGLGEKGALFVLLVTSREDGRVLSGPEIIAHGVVAEDRQARIVADSRAFLAKMVRKHQQELTRGAKPEFDLPERMRVELRRYLQDRIGRRPTVIPLVTSV